MVFFKQDYSELEHRINDKDFDILRTSPSPKVSVVIPFFGTTCTPANSTFLTGTSDTTLTNLHKLILVLTSLSVQNYPSDLLEIIVSYDGPGEFESFKENIETSLKVFNINIANLVVVNPCKENASWGKSQAFNYGFSKSSGELILSLDADMVLHQDHIASLVRWFKTKEQKIVVFGSKKIVPNYFFSEQVVSLIKQNKFNEIPVGEVLEHEWFNNFVQETNFFKTAGSKVFSLYVGASVMLPRFLLEQTKGYDSNMVLAEDTELGYRLHNLGAIFIPDTDSKAWHLGSTNMTRNREVLIPHNHALLSQRVPLMYKLRKNKHSIIYKTPTVFINIIVTEDNAEAHLKLVNGILAGLAGFDAKINLILPEDFSLSRYTPVNDFFKNVRKVYNKLEYDPRVTFSSICSSPSTDTPFIMFINKPVPLVFLSKIFKIIVSKDVGVVALPSKTGDSIVSIFRIAALNRSTWSVDENFNSLLDKANSSWGLWWVTRFELSRVKNASSYKKYRRKLKKSLRKALFKFFKFKNPKKSLKFSKSLSFTRKSTL